MSNKFTPRPSDIDRLTDDEMILIIMEKLLTDKQTVLDIVKWLRFDSGYNYGKTYAYQLVKDTKEYIADIFEETARNSIKNASAVLFKQLADAEKRGDFRLAFDIQKELNKIAGLYKENVDITIDHTIKTSWGK